jgi:hypothetical protein
MKMSIHLPRVVSRCAFALLALWAGGLLAAVAPAHARPPVEGRDALAARREALADALAHSPFGRPLLIRSSKSEDAPHGEVDAVIDHSFASVAEALRRPDNWCAVLMLQTNIKRCSVSGEGAGQQLAVGIARRYTDRVSDAQEVDFRFGVQAEQPDYLEVTLSAPQGPLGTTDYSLRFEAAPAGPGRTFVHLAYAYETSVMARMATSAYLATSGKDKVGFTIVGRDGQGRPQYVGGIQGVAERNTMRYFLAIDAFLDTLAMPPPQRLDARLREFHAALEHYPAQLHETGTAEYLRMKRREIAQG